MSDYIDYEIIDNIGELSRKTSGWAKEVNLISWNGATPKYDIREWSSGHETMGKGISLSKEEIMALKDLLEDIHW